MTLKTRIKQLREVEGTMLMFIHYLHNRGDAYEDTASEIRSQLHYAINKLEKEIGFKQTHPTLDQKKWSNLHISLTSD